MTTSVPSEPDKAGPEERNTLSKIFRCLRWAAIGLIVLLVIGLGLIDVGAVTGKLYRTPLLSWLTDRIAGHAPATSKYTTETPEGLTLGGPFQLTDNHGRSVTDTDYRGRWMLVYFGYTNCPDACPLTLQKLTVALKDLGPLAERLAPLFITVDPARDTPSQLASYLENFDTRIVGLTGSSQQIAAVAKAYRVYYAPDAPATSGNYLVGHSSILYLIDPSGRFDALLPADAEADELAVVLRSKLSKR